MNFRQAKKIIVGHCPNWRAKFQKMRPPYRREDGVMVCPSWHDIDIVRRAMKVYLRHSIPHSLQTFFTNLANENLKK